MNIPFLSSAVKNTQIRKIAADVGVVLTGNSMASVLNLASFTLMVNRTGAEAVAIFTLAQTYSLVINDIFNIQTWESMVKFGSAEMENKENTRNFN